MADPPRFRYSQTRPRTSPADARQRLARGTRFFARLLSCDLECPHCGAVYQIRARRNGQRRDTPIVYDWTTGRLTCGACMKVYVLGLVAWPVAPAPKVATGTPRDQVPNLRQLSELRKDGGGWWLPQADRITRAIPDETNLTTELDRRPGEALYEEDPDEF